MHNNSVKAYKSIFLIGMMGAGKSSFGKYCSKELGYQFVDLDEELENRTGVKIPEIFAKEGEEGFRRRETALLREFIEKEGFIVATGGGVVTRDENREILKNGNACVVHLTVSPRICFFRTRNSSRPLLQTENPMQTIENLMRDRDPLYTEVRDFSLDTDKLSFNQMCKELLKELGKEK